MIGVSCSCYFPTIKTPPGNVACPVLIHHFAVGFFDNVDHEGGIVFKKIMAESIGDDQLINIGGSLGIRTPTVSKKDRRRTFANDKPMVPNPFENGPKLAAKMIHPATSC